MGFRFDDKGKIFTDIVSTEPVPAYIQLPGYRIYGLVHVRPGERIKDELNQAKEFLAVTAAVVYDNDGAVLYQTDFIAINRSQIVWVIPEDDLLPDDPESAGGS